jgi:hypothetical protein
MAICVECAPFPQSKPTRRREGVERRAQTVCNLQWMCDQIAKVSYVGFFNLRTLYCDIHLHLILKTNSFCYRIYKKEVFEPLGL